MHCSCFKNIKVLSLLTLFLVLAKVAFSTNSQPQVEYVDSQDTSEEFYSDPEVDNVVLPDTSEKKTNEAKIVTHKVKRGDTLSSIWTRYTGNTSGGMQAETAFKKVNVPVSSLKVGDNVELQISPEGDITALKKDLERGKKILLDGDSANGYEASLYEPVLKEEQKVISGTITSNLARDAVSQGVPYEVINSFVDLLANDIEFRRDLQPGDTFSVVYKAYSTEDGEIVGVGPIKNASMYTKGKLHVAISYIGSDNKLRYYDEDGNAIGDYFLRYPLKYSRISSVFSNSRKHPVLGIWRPHYGVDFAAPTGTPVRSVGSGRVTFIGTSGGAGRMIKIQHNDKYASMYMHLSAFKKGLKNRSTVERGEVIGYVGATGLATGPHLDFRFSINGKFIDPLKTNLPQLSTSSEQIPQKRLQAALRHIRRKHQTQNMLAMNNKRNNKKPKA